MSRAPNRHTQHCGLVAMVGAPNVGKSTLTNRLVGAKVAIVTPKAQTTRSRVIGVRSEAATQVVLVDTPGIFRPKRRLDRAMVHTAWREAGDADEVCLLIDSNKGVDPPARAIADRLHEAGRQVTAVFNKIDLVPRSKLLHLVESLVQIVKCREVFMISAQSGDGVDDLFADLVKQMPLGPWLFPEDQLSDMSDRLMAAEITREKLMISLRNELPYDLAVETDDWQEFQNGALRISQVVYVARESQKGIVLGNNGAQIRRIREAAQRDLHAIYGTRIHLFIQVKVRPHWDDDPQHFQDLGLDYNA